jgi:hypothetical protein
MRIWGIAAAAVLVAAGSASAQQNPGPFVYRPIDTNQLVVQPADAAANVTAATTSGTLRTIGRSVANMIENNGIVRTVNNLLGQRATPTSPVQAGYSPLPQPTSYLSTRYPNSFTPAMPVMSTFGQTPTVPLPTGTTANR